MSKSKHAKPDEFQKEQIRHLKKEVRRKDQRIRQLEKELGYSQTRTEPTRTRKEPPKCPECGRGEISLVDMGIRLYAICNFCKNRERIS